MAEGLIPHLQSQALWAGLGGCFCPADRELGRREHKVRGLAELSKWKEFPGA